MNATTMTQRTTIGGTGTPNVEELTPVKFLSICRHASPAVSAGFEHGSRHYPPRGPSTWTCNRDGGEGSCGGVPVISMYLSTNSDKAVGLSFKGVLGAMQTERGR